jgi:hypothetical protein
MHEPGHPLLWVSPSDNLLGAEIDQYNMLILDYTTVAPNHINAMSNGHDLPHCYPSKADYYPYFQLQYVGLRSDFVIPIEWLRIKSFRYEITAVCCQLAGWNA